MKPDKEQREIIKIEEKKREFYHKEMMKQDRRSRNRVKVAPSDDVIIFKNINKIYGNHIQAVFNFDLSIKENEFIVLVGPSGCGKSTTLKMIAGLEEITSGDLFLNGKYSNDVTSQNRNLAMVFQSYALYPTMTVYKNIAFPLTVRHEKHDVIDEKVRAIAKTLELDEDMLKRRPAALSGGQRQRVALARAMVKGSNLLLMDEPLSNLDAKLRVAVRSEIVSLHRKLNATTIYVTHDQTEAMTMADRIVVMDKGYIQQVGAPQEIYDHPANVFVATFIGAPSMNIVNTTVEKNKISLENGVDLTLNAEQVKTIEKYFEDVVLEVENDIKNKEAEKEKRIHDLENIGYLKDVDKFDRESTKKFAEIKADRMALDKKDPNSEEYKLLADKIAAKEQALKDYTEAQEKMISEKVYSKLSEEKLNEVVAKDSYIKIYNLELSRMKTYLENYKELVKKDAKELIFGVRPEDIILTTENKDRKHLSMEFGIHIDLVELLGHEYYLTFKIGETLLNIKASATEEILPDTDAKVNIDMDKIHLFDPISKRRIF